MTKISDKKLKTRRLFKNLKDFVAYTPKRAAFTQHHGLQHIKRK